MENFEENIREKIIDNPNSNSTDNIQEPIVVHTASVPLVSGGIAITSFNWICLILFAILIDHLKQ